MASLPLSGRQIVVTRALEQAGPIVEVLSAAGANVISMPLIEIIEPRDGGAARDAVLANIGSYEWLVVSSPELQQVGQHARSAKTLDQLNDRCNPDKPDVA